MFRIAFSPFGNWSIQPVQQDQGIELNSRVDQTARRVVSTPQNKEANVTPIIDMIDWVKRLN
jgi:hypothetical protein